MEWNIKSLKFWPWHQSLRASSSDASISLSLSFYKCYYCCVLGYALLNHACLANAKVVIGKDNYNLEVRAQTAITAGDEITTRYIGVNTGAPVRSEIIAQHWGFVCACIRYLRTMSRISNMLRKSRKINLLL